ncbi:ABC transporter ATP-binding protein [Glaciecola sp. KUL10]|uniref:ABC transporter ATP-binding protein n=1 Tax=Glaciecola sp. (strain KUL10) TaxID=2161813 RepID=UPI000D78ADC1|nr:ABC transporter ATP-binding protein [Glaciecola sp. KUL10]GBL03710.1 ABC transporter ATP-binding protein [Glaciecola sp. KUL10]
MKTSAIDINKLTFSYPKSKHSVLDIANLKIEQGQHTFLSGASGSGKSTLLNLLCGMLVPTSGSIDVLGQELGQLSPSQTDAFRAKHLGVVFQQFNLIPYLSVFDNLKTAAYFASDDAQHSENLLERCQQICQSLKLPDSILAQSAGSLSVGQAQRVAIARAMINAPKILIADEPTSALDEDATLGFLALLFEVSSKHDTTILFVSHDKRLADRFEQHIRLSDINSAAPKEVG